MALPITPPATPEALLAPVGYPEQAEELARLNSVNLAIPDQPVQFLREVWRVIPQGQLIGLMADSCYFSKKEQVLKTTASPEWVYRESLDTLDIQGLMAWAKERNTAQNALPGLGSIYWNTASRNNSVLQGYNARGGSKDLLNLGALWCDLDLAQHGNLPLVSGMRALESLALPPSIVIFSGGGLQAIHLLDSPWGVQGVEAVAEFKDISLSFYTPLKLHGIGVDSSVHEATRMMRVPGFINKKPSRGGAIARIVYWQPDRRYSPEQIRGLSPIAPKQPRLPPMPIQPLETGEFRVTHEFISYLCEGNQPIERHPVARKLALQAAKAGIPSQEFMRRFRPVVYGWFARTGESHRAGDELDRLVEWAYGKIAEDPASAAAGYWIVKISPESPDRFISGGAAELVPVVIPAVERGKSGNADNPDNLINLDNPDNKTGPGGVWHVNLDPETPEIDTTLYKSLPEIRTEQTQAIENYLSKRIRRGVGTNLLLRTPPGVGKTHALWTAAREQANKHLEGLAEKLKRDPAAALNFRGRVAFLTLFKFDENNYQEQIESEFGIDASGVYYLVARNSDKQSRGYCELNQVAEIMANKGYIVKKDLCDKCPVAQACKERGYLSQFEQAKKAPILLGRHQHGQIEELTKSRDLVIFDESPLPLVSAATRLTPDLLVYSTERLSPFQLTQEAESITAIKRVIDGFQRVTLSNQNQDADSRYTPKELLILGGRGVFDRLKVILGGGQEADQIMRDFADLTTKQVRDLTKPGMRHDFTPETAESLPVNYIVTLHSVFSHEYKRYYADNPVPAWNSRIVLSGGSLCLYAMEPFKFPQRTRIIISDATGPPDQFERALADTSGKPRKSYIYDAQIKPKSQITQYTGSNNSKSTMIRPGTVKDKSGQDITNKLSGIADQFMLEASHSLFDDPALNAPVTEAIQGLQELKEATKYGVDNDAIRMVKELIESRYQLHGGDLLVVTYKDLVFRLRLWAIQKFGKVWYENNLKWFGGLRGKNQWKQTSAVLLIGTHQIPETELLTLAQVWNWDSDLPVDSTRVQREILYPGYRDPLGNGRKHVYPGYLDNRVNALYLNLMIAEGRQCYERIRPETEPGDKFVYIASNFPISEHIERIYSRMTYSLDEHAENLIKQGIQGGRTVYEGELAARLAKEANVSEITARRAIRRIFATADYLEIGTRAQMSAGDRILEIIKSNPGRLTSNQIAELAGCDPRTVRRVLSAIEGVN